MVGDRFFRVWRKSTVVVKRRIPLKGVGGSGLYGGVMYTSSMTVSRQSAVVRLSGGLGGLGEDSIDSLIDEAVKEHVGDSKLDSDKQTYLPDKRYDDGYGGMEY